MSDDLDDDLNLDESFDEIDNKGKTLGDLWRDNAAFKIGTVVGGAVLLFVAISLFSSDREPVQESFVSAAPNIKSTPGTEEASPAYVRAIEELNEADIERAMTEGDSSLPVPIEPPIGVVNLPEQNRQEEDPLQRWRRLQEERLEREMQARSSSSASLPDQNAVAAAAVERTEAVQRLSETMSAQMSSILETKATLSLSTKNLTDPGFLEKLRESELAEAEASEALQSGLDDEVVGEIILPAGEIVYAQLITEANTDVPGPVLAQILSGPLKGSRILGTFEEQTELLTLNFDTVVYKGQGLSVDAIALDPGTTLPGMATEVDHRYLKRILLPAAASFIEGFAGAIGQTAEVTVVTDGGTVVDGEEEPDNTEEVALGVEEVGQKLSEIIDQIANDTEVLVRIEAGTPIGILFLEPVTTDDNPNGIVQVSEEIDGGI